MNNTNYLSIAISASFIRYALFDESGSLKVKKQVPTPTDSVENFLKQIYEIVTDHLKSIYGIGLSVPGQVDPKDGVIYQGGLVAHAPRTQPWKNPCHSLRITGVDGKYWFLCYFSFSMEW